MTRFGNPLRSPLAAAVALTLLAAASTAPHASAFQLDDLLAPIGGPSVTPPSRFGQSVATFSTRTSAPAARPGGQIAVAIVIDVQDGWHLQPAQPDWENAIPFEFTIEGLPDGVIYGDTQYPELHAFEGIKYGPPTQRFYAGRAVLFTRVSVGADVAPGDYPITATVKWQACDDSSCLPPRTQRLDLTLGVSDDPAATAASDDPLFAGFSGPSDRTLRFDVFRLTFEVPAAIWAILPLAAIGGFFLNLTPCVLPLIPIKVMGLSQAASSRGRCLALGLVMFLGVIAFWIGLGAVIASVTGFTSTNQLFQYPTFTISVGVLIAVMAVGMLGMFAVRLPQWVYRINPKHDTVVGSFGFGIMTAVLSTPCTAPFMGTAAGWATTQPASVTLGVFAAIGFGMAIPYLVLAAFPVLVEKMPRTGPASELVKQVMGLLMLAAAAYFLGAGLTGALVTPPDPPSLAFWWAVALFSVAAGAWLGWRTIRITRSAVRRVAFVGVGAFMIVAGTTMAVRFTDRGPIDWVYYTPDRLAEARERGDVVVIDFTAQWCANCLALEQAYLHQDGVANILNGSGVTPIKVDLTGNNDAGNALLAEMGRRSIPLLVILDPDGSERFKSDAYTATQVIDAVSEAQARTLSAAAD